MIKRIKRAVIVAMLIILSISALFVLSSCEYINLEPSKKPVQPTPDNKPEPEAPTSMFGSTQTITAVGDWNLQLDFAQEHENYSSRKISLEYRAGEYDIAFKDLSGTHFAVEATFNLSVDGTGKNGIMLYDGANDAGFFYYIDSANEVIGADYLGGEIEYSALTVGDIEANASGIKLCLGCNDGVISVWYEYGGSAVLAGQFAYVAENSLNIGFKSFNGGVQISEYSATADENDENFKQLNPPVVCADTEILRITDKTESIFESLQIPHNAFYLANARYFCYDNALATAKMKFKPEKVILDLSGENSADEVKAVIDSLVTEFPQSHIYFLPAVSNKKDYRELNGEVKSYAQVCESFDYIDIDAALYDERGDLRKFLTAPDGQLNGIYGYPLIGDIIKTTLGMEVAGNEYFGYNGYARISSTNGWIFGGDCILKSDHANGERTAFYKKAPATSDILFEATVNLGENSKAGAVLFNDDYMILGYVCGGKVGICYQKNALNGISERTILEELSYSPKTIGIAKFNNKIYLLGDGKVIATAIAPQTIHESLFIAGICVLDGGIEVTDFNYTTDSDILADRLLERYAIKVNSPAEVDIKIDKEEALAGESVSFTVSSQKIISRVLLRCAETEREIVCKDGRYEFEMPDGEVEISVITAVAVDLSSTDGKVMASELAPEVGTKITFSAVEGFVIDKLYINGELLEKVDGIYRLEITEETGDLEVTATVFFGNGGILLDGEAEEIYGNIIENEVEGGRSYSVRAIKVEAGVWIFADAYTCGIVTSGEVLSRFDFSLNGGELNSVDISDSGCGVTEFIYTYELMTGGAFAGKYGNFVEIFVDKKDIPDFDEGEIRLNYRWIIPDENARILTEKIISPGLVYGDSWSGHAIGGISDNSPDNLYITDKGIKIVEISAKNGEIDGSLTEFANVGTVRIGDKNLKKLAYADICAYSAVDGLYLGITVYHGDFAAANPVWYENDNIQIDINGKITTLIFGDGVFQYGLPIAEGVALTVGDGAVQETTVEIFIPVKSESYRLRFKTGGQGFGTSTLLWDGSYYLSVTERGFSVPAHLDGDFADPVWDGDAADKTLGYTANGKNYVETFGLNTAEGVIIGIKVAHENSLTKAADQVVSLKLNGDDLLEITPYNSLQNEAVYSYKTDKNGGSDWLAFTTYYEIFIPHSVNSMVIGAVIDGEASDLFGGEIKITDFGLESDYILDGNMTETVWTEQVKSNAITEFFGTARITTRAVKAASGMWIYYQIDSMQSIFACFSSWNTEGYQSYLHIQLNVGQSYLAEAEYQYVAVCARTNTVYNAKCGYKTSYNGSSAEYTFTTAYKVFLSFETYPELQYDEEIALCTLATADASTKWVTGSKDWNTSNCAITENGLIKTR